MSVVLAPRLSQFALDVAEGLSQPQKRLSPSYLYDDLGSALFEAITLLPEYGLTRADERLLAAIGSELGRDVGRLSLVAELGSGSGKKTRHILNAVSKQHGRVPYFPIDVSASALDACRRELSDLAEVRPLCQTWLEGLTRLTRERPSADPMLLLFLGSSIGNIDRAEIPTFLQSLRAHLREGDLFLLGADLVKPIDRMIVAYDDPTGVTAAFNRNVLGRMNRELDARFDLSLFEHEARWMPEECRIEMHLVSRRRHSVYIGALETSFNFREGETIWTESSHKFTLAELNQLANSSGFQPADTWTDEEWSFAEALWEAV
jgi:L-histidine N-alpha-methyltransferase